MNNFYDRTAGVVTAVRPCGIVLDFSEMFTCESSTQMYIHSYFYIFFFLELFTTIEVANEGLK